MTVYRPKFVKQYDDPTTSLDWFNCAMASGAMALDFDTLGHVQVLGGQLRSVSGDLVGGTTLGSPGLTRAWAYYGQTLHVMSGTHWDDVMVAIKASRGVVLLGMYGALPKAYRSPLNSLTFTGPHAVYLNPEVQSDGSILMGDPLNDKFIWVPEASLRGFANSLGSREYGPSTPQRIFFATTDPHVPAVTPSDPMPYVHTVKVTATPSLNVRSQPTTTAPIVHPGSLATGTQVKTTQLRKYGGKYVAGGTVRTDWLGFVHDGNTVWIARAYTQIVV